MTKKPMIAGMMVLLATLGVGWFLWQRDVGPLSGWRVPTETVTLTDYHPPTPEAHPIAADDRLQDKMTTFDPDLVDRRPEGDWLINQSAAVIRLDVPMVKPDIEPKRLVLYPSYAAAMAAETGAWETLLPSVNLIDGKAKQFDDGLVAALHQAIFAGKTPALPDPISVVKRLAAAVGPESPAAPFLAAGLSLVGVNVTTAPTHEPEKRDWLAAFERNQVRSKPIGIYTWNQTLSAGFRFHRFFQQEFASDSLAIPRALVEALQHDPKLLGAYQRVVGFDARLTNRASCLTLNDLIDHDQPLRSGALVAVFPASASREQELYERLFPRGLPEGADLMSSLILRIRSGEVDLLPRKESGWYEQQVYALETLLLPEKGPESNKLLLTKSYKLRMLEAFKALVTKRRETHVMNAKGAASPMPIELKEIRPRLRVEPCPSFYLRTARAYAFISTFLESFVGEDNLKSLHGLRENGERPLDLHSELAAIRDLFYGLALLSSEDIGARPGLHDDEPIDRDRCERIASEWLAQFKTDPDLNVDTRVSVPVYSDGNRATRLWVTLGVRMTFLEASYARGPKVKPKDGDASDRWEDVEPYRLATMYCLIPVDEFAEVELRGNRVLTRKELRAVCDSQRSKTAIISALQR